MRRNLATAFVFLAAVPVRGQAAQSFTMLRRDFQVADGTSSITTGDFDGDKKPDLLLIGSFGLSLLRGTGDGTFQPGITTATGTTGGFPFPILVADFNGDGRMDVPIGTDLYLGQADGSFRILRQTDPLFLVSPYISSLITADFNEDGTPDLAGFDGSSYRVLLGKGDGTFQRSFSISGVAIAGVIGGTVRSYTTDINRDGHVDLALRSTDFADNPTVFRIFNGNGKGSFQEARSVRVPLRGAQLAAQGDFNGDQIIDWALNTGNASSLLLGNPDGTFQEPTPLDAYVGLSGDFDSDGRPDLVLINGRATIYLGSGHGFSPSVRASGGYPILSADWNGDGRLDLVTSQSGYVSILLNMQVVPGENAITAIESSATPLAVVAPGSLATLFGSGLSTGTEASPILSGTLAGTQLQVRDAAGQTLPAELLYVSPNQINFRIPPTATLGDATVAIASGTGAFVPMGVAQVEASAPTLFGCGRGTNSVIAAAEPGADSFSFEPPPCPGDQLRFPAIVTLYGTGFAGATVDNTQVWVHGLPLKPLYVGPAGTVPGLDKVVIRVQQSDLVQSQGDSLDGYASWVYITMAGRKTNGGYTGIY
jgi:uncharacterized protein (TIGR03437 family)